MRLWRTDGSPNLGQKTRPYNNQQQQQQQQKRIYKIVDFAVPVDHRIKLKERPSALADVENSKEVNNNNKIKTKYPILARRPDLVISHKKRK